MNPKTPSTFVTQGPRLLQVVWLVVVTSCLVICVVHSAQLIAKYLAEDVIGSYNPRGTRFQFPDIYLCPELPFAKSVFHDAAAKNSTNFGDLIRDINKIHAIQGMVTTKDQRGLFVWETIDWKRLFDVLGHQSNQTITHIDSSPDTLPLISVEDIYQRSHKRCFLVKVPSNHGYTESYIKLGVFIDAIQDVTMRSFLRAFGLSNDEYTNSLRLYFVDKEVYPSRETEFIRIQPGYLYDVRLSMFRTRLYNSSSRPCYEENMTFRNPLYQPETITSADTYKSCLDATFQRFIVEQCGCYILQLTSGLIEPEIFDQNVACFNVSAYLAIKSINHEEIENLTKHFDCYLRTKANFEKIRHSCQNKIKCTSTRYFLFKSKNSWPSEFNLQRDFKTYLSDPVMNRKLNGYSIPGLMDLFKEEQSVNNSQYFLKYFRRSMAKVNIYSKQAYSATEDEFIQYPITNLLSDLGGVLNLYLGMSILSFLKVFDIIHRVRYRWSLRETSHDEISPQESLANVKHVIDWESEIFVSPNPSTSSNKSVLNQNNSTWI